MLPTTYKTSPDTTDQQTAYLLIAGFFGQLKGWQDNYLSGDQRDSILNAIRVDDIDQTIFDDYGQPVQDAVSTLIYSISQHFIGDPSVIRDQARIYIYIYMEK